MALKTETKIKRLIGDRIKAARLRAKLTREGAGKLIGVSPKTLQGWEEGRAFPDRLAHTIKLIDVLGGGDSSLIFGGILAEARKLMPRREGARA